VIGVKINKEEFRKKLEDGFKKVRKN